LYSAYLLFGRISHYSRTFVLQENQIRLVEEDGLKSTSVVGLVTLNTVGTNGRTTTCIEHPVLETREIRVYGHLAAKGVYFKYEVRLRQPAD
jgi:hypothetical protein